jgi:hypothetical protein
LQVSGGNWKITTQLALFSLFVGGRLFESVAFGKGRSRWGIAG